MSTLDDFKAGWAEYDRRRQMLGIGPRLAFEYKDSNGYPCYVNVQPDGGIFVQGHHGMPENEIPRFVAWLKEVYSL